MSEKDNKKEKKAKKKARSQASMRKASNANYMAGVTVLAVVFVIIINLISNALSTNITQIDLSRKDIFTLTDTSVNYLKNLDQDITIITLASSGSEYADLQRLLNDYAAHSSHIKLETKDPAKSPDIVSKYNANMTQGSIVVVCGDRYKAIDLTDMVISTSVDSEDTSSSSSSSSSSGYVYYQYDMEGQITNAIDYVTSEKTMKAYVLTGSGKSVLGTVESDIQKQNIDVEDLNLENEGAIPEDADFLIINSMTGDFTDKEYRCISDYLDNGGSLFIAEEYKMVKTDAVLPNFDAILERYGLSVNHVTVLEQNNAYYYTSDNGDYNFMVKPVLRSHEITQDLIDAGASLLLIASDKVDIEEKDGVTVVPLLESSGTAYYKSKSDSSYAKLNTDPSGTYTYAVAATQALDDGKESKLVYSGSYSVLAREGVANINDTLAEANTKFVINSMKWITGQEDTVYVDKKSKSYNRLVYVHDVDVKIGYLTVGIPAAILIVGGIIWYRRRKK